MSHTVVPNERLLIRRTKDSVDIWDIYNENSDRKEVSFSLLHFLRGAFW